MDDHTDVFLQLLRVVRPNNRKVRDKSAAAVKVTISTLIVQEIYCTIERVVMRWFLLKSKSWVFLCCLFMFRIGIINLKNIGYIFHAWFEKIPLFYPLKMTQKCSKSVKWPKTHFRVAKSHFQCHFSLVQGGNWVYKSGLRISFRAPESGSAIFYTSKSPKLCLLR